MIVTDERVARFVEEKTGCTFHPPYTCIGREVDGKIVGGAVFTSREDFDIHISIGGSGFSREILSQVGEYVFGQMKCERMTALTEKENVVRIAKRLGFKVEGCLRSHFGKGRDAIVLGVLADEYRF